MTHSPSQSPETPTSPSNRRPPELPGQRPPNPNHHLWKNGRYWWVAFTIIIDGWRQKRVRCSLRTTDLETARWRRDELLEDYPFIRGCQLSLRYPRR